MILYAPYAAKHPNLNGSGNPKDYPWPTELARMLEKHGKVVQVGGTTDKQLVEHFVSNPSFEEVSQLIKACDTGVTVDSYLQHHMWFLGRRAVVLWGISDPDIFGHPCHINLLKDRANLRKNQFDLYYSNQHRPEAFVSPEEVLQALNGRGLSYDGQTA